MKRALLPFLFLLPATAFGWTRTVDFRIARKAAEMSPPDLHVVLKKFGKQYTKGVDRALGEDGTNMHRERLLRTRIEEETNLTIKMIRSNEPMAMIAERLGYLVHLVGDANNPFYVTRDDGLEPSRDDFARYVERRMEVFPTVSYGIDRNLALGSYLDRVFARTEKLAPLMSEEYFRGGSRRTSAEFDDRSTAFGVASITYSHAITDAANLFTYIWKKAGGDVRAAN